MSEYLLFLSNIDVERATVLLQQKTKTRFRQRFFFENQTSSHYAPGVRPARAKAAKEEAEKTKKELEEKKADNVALVKMVKQEKHKSKKLEKKVEEDKKEHALIQEELAWKMDQVDQVEADWMKENMELCEDRKRVEQENMELKKWGRRVSKMNMALKKYCKGLELHKDAADSENKILKTQLTKEVDWQGLGASFRQEMEDKAGKRGLLAVYWLGYKKRQADEKKEEDGAAPLRPPSPPADQPTVCSTTAAWKLQSEQQLDACADYVAMFA